MLGEEVGYSEGITKQYIYVNIERFLLGYIFGPGFRTKGGYSDDIPDGEYLVAEYGTEAGTSGQMSGGEVGSSEVI